MKNKVKWARQRITKGYCDYDLWDIDSWIPKLLSNALNEFAEKTHSHPYDFTHEEWQATIREIATHFKNYDNDWDWGNPYDINKDIENWRKAEKEHQDYMESELHKGFVLLEKHFGNLWD